MIVFQTLQVYRSRRMMRRTHEVQLLLKAHGIALLLFVAITYLFSEYHYSRGVMIWFGSISAVALVSFRLILRNALRSLRKKGYNLRHVLIVGESGSTRTLLEHLHKFPELGLRARGIVTHGESKTQSLRDVPVLGAYEMLPQLIRKTGADQVIVALPRDQYALLDSILNSIKDEMVDLQLIPDVHEYVTLGCEVEEVEGLPIVRLNDSPLGGWMAIGKRLMDGALAALALLALAPVFTVIAVAVRLTSKGPIFYGQERMGLDGRTFKMWKFRSMRVNAESVTGAVWASVNDDRRTPIGTLLRGTSLDELPQFWNVLVGDMSLVGPRPERPVFVHQFKSEIPHYMLRHKVKAGITGWAQVNGWRGDTSLEKRIECDLYYIRNWSFLLDIKILFLTLWKGFVNKNAY
jgi:Undecaprenyl-phosphate glucose phosphotransferase